LIFVIFRTCLASLADQAGSPRWRSGPPAQAFVDARQGCCKSGIRESWARAKPGTATGNYKPQKDFDNTFHTAKPFGGNMNWEVKTHGRASLPSHNLGG